MMLHDSVNGPAVTHNWTALVTRALEWGAIAVAVLAAGFVGLYTVLFVLGRLGLL